jgi:hypothetical protein
MFKGLCGHLTTNKKGEKKMTLKTNPQCVTDNDFLNEMTHKPIEVEDIDQMDAPEIPYDLFCYPEVRPQALWVEHQSMDCFLTLDFDFNFNFHKFILTVGEKNYFVDTQGYDYMRYIIEIT